MPPQVAHWPDVKATAIATGSLREAAEAHGISHDAVRQRACREEWPVGQRVHKMLQAAQEQANTQMSRASKGAVTHVTSAADALQSVLAENKRRSQVALSSYVAKTSEHADTLSGEEALAQAPSVKAVADIYGKVWPDQQGTPGISLNFFTLSQDRDDAERPIIDVEQA